MLVLWSYFLYISIAWGKVERQVRKIFNFLIIRNAYSCQCRRIWGELSWLTYSISIIDHYTLKELLLLIFSSTLKKVTIEYTDNPSSPAPRPFFRSFFTFLNAIACWGLSNILSEFISRSIKVIQIFVVRRITKILC